MMRAHDMIKKAACILIFIMMPVLALGNPIETFPDLVSLRGLKSIRVVPVMFEHMENVKLTPEALQIAIQGKLRQASITLRLEGSSAPGHLSSEADLQEVGILSATVRRSTSPGPLVSMNSFSVSLRFFQTARIQSSGYQGWVITWLGNRSVVVGMKRPQHIAAILDELVESFIQDFRPAGTSRKK